MGLINVHRKKLQAPRQHFIDNLQAGELILVLGGSLISLGLELIHLFDNRVLALHGRLHIEIAAPNSKEGSVKLQRIVDFVPSQPVSQCDD